MEGKLKDCPNGHQIIWAPVSNSTKGDFGDCPCSPWVYLNAPDLNCTLPVTRVSNGDPNHIQVRT